MKIKVKYDRNGNVKKVIGNVGQTRMNRAALELWKGNVEPTFGYKLRRFVGRAFTELSARAERTAADHIVGSQAACEIPYICLDKTSG